MKTSTKFLLATAMLGILGLGGLARSVYATQPKPTVAIIPQHRASTQIAEASDGDGELADAIESPEARPPHRPGTQIAEASDGDVEEADDAEEKQEATKLQALAKITPQQAQKAAETALGGKASRVKLDNEDGNLVYKVTIGQTQVAVDAGNTKVLYTENINQPDSEAAEASRPKSSIQVPDRKDKGGQTSQQERSSQ